MNFPIETLFAPGGTMYAVVHHPDGTVWNDVNQVFEAFNVSVWNEYAIPLTEQGSTGYYTGVYPAAITDVLTSEALYLQTGGGPVVTDGQIGIAQSQGSAIAAVRDNVNAAKNMEEATGSEQRGTVNAGVINTTQCPTNLEDTTDGVYVGRVIIFTSGGAIRQASNILTYDGTSKILTYAPLSAGPSEGDTFIII